MQQLFEINGWVESLLESGKIQLSKNWHIKSLQGDASCRRYFRLFSDFANMILVASPPDRINNDIFVSIANLWQKHKVNVPIVYHVDEQKGYMLIEDFGNTHLFDLLTKEFGENTYQMAIDQLFEIQKVPHSNLVQFDEAFLLREMNLFDTWLVQYQLELKTPKFLSSIFDLLVSSSLEQPQVTMHRDYHSRNLLIKDEKIAVIDFQDAVIGPITYDLASLLRDCYINISDAQTNRLIDYYLGLLENQKGLMENVSRSQFVRWFDLIGLQRHLKVLGLFVRLGVEEGKTDYLYEIPRVFNYVLKIAGKYPELIEFNQWLVLTIAPALTGQKWYVAQKPTASSTGYKAQELS